MKIFKFDPISGKRGEQIDNARRGNYTDQSVSYQVEHGLIEPVEHAAPCGFGSNANVTVHVDAGREYPACTFNSYQTDEWICYCLGDWGSKELQAWEWVVLPPAALIKKVAA